MQPYDVEESQKSTADHKKTGECLFDLSKHGGRLELVAFRYRSCDDMESKYYTFTGKEASG